MISLRPKPNSIQQLWQHLTPAQKRLFIITLEEIADQKVDVFEMLAQLKKSCYHEAQDIIQIFGHSIPLEAWKTSLNLRKLAEIAAILDLPLDEMY